MKIPFDSCVIPTKVSFQYRPEKKGETKRIELYVYNVHARKGSWRLSGIEKDSEKFRTYKIKNIIGEMSSDKYRESTPIEDIFTYNGIPYFFKYIDYAYLHDKF